LAIDEIDSAMLSLAGVISQQEEDTEKARIKHENETRTLNQLRIQMID